MRKVALIFPILLVALIHSECTTFAPRPYYDYEYVDLDRSAGAQIDDNLKREIKKFYGAPYKWGGSTPLGVDCSGMIMTIYKNAAGIDLPHNAEQMFETLTPIKKSELAFGDLVFFSSNGGLTATHVGLYVIDDFFVHASSSRGVVLSRLTDRPYRKQFIGARRVETH